MSVIDKNLYRPCAGIILKNPHDKIFVGRRIDNKINEAWQMPQGGIDKSEGPLVAAIRELKEETSVVSAKLTKTMDDWLYYDLPEHLQGKLWGGKYIGQKQKWFLFDFIGEEEEINLETKDPEFFEYKWVDKSELVDLAVEFKREIYQKLVDWL